jgi:predicted lysophospholipase L1 biosynthesis ABC-type transport system permease subunit
MFQLIIGEACTMAVIGGFIGSVAACLCMNTAVSLLQKVFDMPQSVWNIGTAVLCVVIGTAFSALLGFLSAMYPAIKSAGLEPQSAITQGEVN